MSIDSRNHGREEQWPPLDQRDFDRVLNTLQRGEISYNVDPREVHELEARFRQYSQHTYCLALNSGT